jgi:hypothetical protein
MDRALSLAEEIAANGVLIIIIVRCAAFTGFNSISEAPLALRSAKLAVSRALELSLEPGELVARYPHSYHTRERAFLC